MTRGIDDAINNSHELTTFEKAFQEVAYAYYMRWPYMHYNASKSMSDILSPEESTSQDYHYMTCTPYVMNVFKELLGIVLTSADDQYWSYAKDYVWIRPEVVWYGEKSGNNLYWWDGTTQYSESPQKVNPDQSYIISQLKIGDILYYAGHTMLVYDYVYSGNDIVDVYLLHSRQANYITRTKADHSNKEKYYNKSWQEIGLKLGNSQRSKLWYNYRDRVGVYPWLSRIEGTVILERLREHQYLTFTQPYESKYSILRLVTTNSSGEDLLNFNGQWTWWDQYNTKKFLYYGFLALGTGPDTLYEPDNSLKTFDNQKINNYSDSVKSRLKYSKLYIEKTVDKKDNNIVEPNDELIYKIVIKNESNENYGNDLIVTEYIDTNLVENLHDYLYSWASSGQVQIETEYENQLQWNIWKLNSGDDVIIEYKVKVKTGHIGKTVESTGLVDNIPSGTIKNKIWRNLKEQDSSLIVEKYEALKEENYTGKRLINKIYEEVYGVDLWLNSLIMTGYISRNGTIIEGQSGLIFYTKTWNAWWNPKIHNYMYINPEHPFSWMVLNSYFNVLWQSGFEAIDRNITLYEVPTLLPYKNPDNRANTIYPTDFKTGDILIYINENDVKYTTWLNSNGDQITKEIPISYEDWEYVYIYIDGKFMGVNWGKDGVKDNNTGGDDRNEFGTIEYHVVNKVDSYNRVPVLSGEYRADADSGCRKEIPESYCIKIPDPELKEFLRYQTLFGKDAYVILRPSLMIRNITYELNGWTNNDENPNGFIPWNDVVLKDPTKTGFTFYGWYTDSWYTNRVNNTSEFTDDVTLYAKWDLTTFQKAFQEVAYAYYMRWPYIHYNSAKGRGHDFSPEEATSQDYNYLACGLYVLNVYEELLGNFISFPPHWWQNEYAEKYVGRRPEVIWYWKLQTGGADSGSLYWWDSTTPYSGDYMKKNPTKSDIINQLQIGDIFGYDGHVMLVYDYKYNESWDIEDVYLIHSSEINQYIVDSKINQGATVYDKSGTGYNLRVGHNKWSLIRYNNFDRKSFSTTYGIHDDARIEWTVNLQTMSDFANTNGKIVLNFNYSSGYSSYYLILRFVTDDGSGNSILSIDGTNLAGYRKCSTCSYTKRSGQINYSDSVQSRLKYNKLYIEKTVDKWDNSVVWVDDELTYTIKIQNNSDKAYDDDLVVKENIDTSLVQNLSRYIYTKNWTQTNEVQLINSGNQLEWNIGKLNSKDELIIQYAVKVKTGHIGETIESTWLVDYIPSGIITNKIWKNTDKGEILKNIYNSLKNEYTGKNLINEIYSEVYGIDLAIDKITEIATGSDSDTWALIYYNNKWWNRGTNYDDVRMELNRKSPYSGMILNGYFNVLYKGVDVSASGSVDEIMISRYGFPAIASNDIDKRADTIFPSNFQTGDILLYKNSNDEIYVWSCRETPCHTKVFRNNTYENWEYAYIYIDGKFVGVNLWSDWISGSQDDRNEFTSWYYTNIGMSWDLRLYSISGNPRQVSMIDMSGWFQDWLQYQSLFGKDAYVILRPSLMIRDITYELSGWANNEENPNGFIPWNDVVLKDPTKTGFTFYGWYTDSWYTNRVYNTSEFTDDVTLYAKWGLTTFEKAFQELAYAYYMRWPTIQYNSMKAAYSLFLPETATTQNSSYLVCSTFTRNIYYRLLGIKIPRYTYDLMDYARDHVWNPEVVWYGVKSGSDFIMKIYDSEASGHYKELIKPKLSDIIPYLRIGDILTYDWHTIVVYDLHYDGSGNIDDAILMHSTHGAWNGYIKTKIPGSTKIGDNISFGSANHHLYHNSTGSAFYSGLLEGSLNITKIKNQKVWKFIWTGDYKDYEYSILRFVQQDDEGNEVLTYHGSDYEDTEYVSEPISLSDKIEDRLKFSKLFIEKTVSEYANDMVELGTTMTYTIVVKNKSNEDYTGDLIITENVSEFVTYSGYTSSKEGIYFNRNGSILTWNIGKLNAEEEVIIQYFVDVDKGNIWDTIVSTGSVGHISSATIKNKIGKALNEDQEANIGNSFESLRGDYTWKELIDKVYQESVGVDLNFKEFDITKLIKHTNLSSRWSDTFYLNTGNSFSWMILNNYRSTLALGGDNYNGTPIYVYKLKYWKSLSNTKRRADTINSENFRTGDILIYTNTNDNIYSYSLAGGLTTKPVTYEDGEYVYIYIDGKFVGVNLGNDGVKDQSTGGDDRNEFTREYYSANSLYWYSAWFSSGTTDEFKDNLHYQTLFGKDYYVILRPSLMIRDITYELDWWTNDNENPNAFILGRDIELKGPIRTWYVFGGWYTDSWYISSVDNTNELTDDVVLYAKWSMDEYSITYVLNNWTVSTANPESYTIESADIILNNPTRTGYDFKWWTGTDLGWLTMSITIPNWSIWDRTYVANWEAKDVGITINHYLQNLDADTNTLLDTYSNYKTSIGVEKADSTITLANYKLTNITWYVYDYWKANWTTTITTTVLPDGSSVFDLYYTRNTYSLAVNWIIWATIAWTSPMGRYYYGSNITLSGDVTNDCYMWSGWNIIWVPSTANKKITFSMPANAVTATQAITEKVYNIVFDGISNTSGSTDSMNNIKCTAGVTLNPNWFSKIWYAFSGWATTSGWAKVYEDEQNVQTLSTWNNANVILYTVWTPNVDTEYKVIHVYEWIGSTPEETVSRTHTWTSDTTVTGQLLSRVWFNNPDEQLVYIKADGTAEITYYYDRTKYTVTYNSNSEAAVDPWTGKYGAEIPRPDLSWLRDWYRFDGWSGVTTVPAENTGLVAQWTAIAVNYTVKHMQENADDTNYFEVESDRQILTGITDTNTNVTAKVYSGFRSWVFTNVSINGDESTVVEVKYDREVYTVSFDSSSGTVVDPITGKYEQNLIAPANPKLFGYTFMWWEPEFPTKMPLDGTGLIAIWEANTGTAYTVEHYLQELDGIYPETPNYIDNLSGTTDTQTNALAKDYEWFTLSGNIEDYQDNIDGHGTTVVKLYYMRDSHTITFIDSDWIHSWVVWTWEYGAETSGKVDFPVWNRTWLTLSWSGEIPAIVPAEDIIVTAIWTVNPTMWWKLKKDNCPGGDFSDSYYDWKCGKSTNNAHGSAAIEETEVSYQKWEEFKYDTSKYNSKYSDEMNQAYQYAYYYGITTKWSIKEADVNWKLTRIAMAKMLSQYAMNVMWLTPDNTVTKKFSDVSNKLDKDYDNWVTLAYQLWIMWINMPDNKFRPNDTVTRAEFVTALSRMKYWTKDGKDVYYSTHMNLLKDLWVITVTNPAMKELRWYVMIMLMRSAK